MSSLISKKLAGSALGLVASMIATSAVAGGYSGGALSTDHTAGFVVGVQGGYANEHWDNYPTSFVDDTGFAMRGFAGYDFNRFLGVETGYTYLPKTTFDNSSANIKNYAIDLLGKLSVPVSDVFKLYAKAGAGYLNSRVRIASVSQTRVHLGPAFGVGAACNIMPNVVFDISWTRFSGDSSVVNNAGGDYQPNPDVWMLGLSYKFPTAFS